MEKNYLPSKQFVARIVIIAGVLIIIFGLYEFFPYISKTLSSAKKRAALSKITVADVVVKDSNNNGIADWEETLWGLDPTKNGPENKETILAKRKSISEANGGKTGINSNLTQNDKIARELLALIVSLKQDNNLTPEAMDKIAKSISDKITTENIADIYSKDKIQSVATTPSSIKTYYGEIKKLNSKYENQSMGDELTFIAQGLNTNDELAIKIAVSVAKSYRAFGQELMLVKVPTSLVDTHLSLANNYEKTAQSIEKMGDILTDQIGGMSAILSYKKYSDALISDLNNMITFFKRNGIIKVN